MLLNLLSNALKASPPRGAIALESRIGDGVWRCSLEDQGPGLKPEQRERMFERFVRFSAPGNEQGSGLGLAICRSIVELHGGRIFALAGTNGTGLRVVVEISATAARETAKNG